MLNFGKTATVSRPHQQHQHQNPQSQSQTQPQHHHHQQQQQLRSVFPTMHGNHGISNTSSAVTVPTDPKVPTTAASVSTNAALNFNMPLISKHQLYKINTENSDNGEQKKLQLIDYDEI